MLSQQEDLLEKYVQHLQRKINTVKMKKGNFATSASVNQDAKLISEELYNNVANHFRALGYTVHAPPSLDTFQRACDNHERNEMTLLRWESRPESLEKMILVEIKE